MNQPLTGNGGTLDLECRPILPSYGYAVGLHPYPSIVDALTEAKPDEYVGYWKDDRTGLYHVDRVKILHDILEAISLAHRHNQLAIWNFERQEEIRLTG